ncbi:MAG TPA: hypothetical protein VNM24_09920 [Burkholderiales bacterium]|nr:hypothetical protein [Burkholderiales bacterium]
MEDARTLQAKRAGHGSSLAQKSDASRPDPLLFALVRLPKLKRYLIPLSSFSIFEQSIEPTGAWLRSLTPTNLDFIAELQNGRVLDDLIFEPFFGELRVIPERDRFWNDELWRWHLRSFWDEG